MPKTDNDNQKIDSIKDFSNNMTNTENTSHKILDLGERFLLIFYPFKLNVIEETLAYFEYKNLITPDAPIYLCCLNLFKQNLAFQCEIEKRGSQEYRHIKLVGIFENKPYSKVVSMKDIINERFYAFKSTENIIKYYELLNVLN